MRSDTDHREQLDDFSEFMKRKLEDHRLSVDDLCWEEIEPRMKSRQRNFVWWIGSSVAAAVAVILLLLPFQMEEKLSDKINEQEVSSFTEEITPAVPEVSPEEVIPPVDKAVGTKKLVAVASVKQPVVNITEQPKEEVTALQPEVVSDTDDTVNKPATDTEKEGKKEPGKQMDLNHYESKKYRFVSPERKKEKKDWSVNASFGTGGDVSLNLLGSSNDAIYGDMNNSIGPGIPLPPPEVEPPFTNNGMIPAEEYGDIDCSLPLSFGVTVRKDLSRYIGVETGLVYTYLASRMTRGGKISYNSRLNLHYLGVPVNLVVKLWSNPKWNIYMSGGVMLEKGLRSKQTQEEFSLSGVETLVEKKGISGVQWSLNGSAGVSYRLHRDWSIYLEPRISYYFDNDQPVSIRTENSVIIGLGAGFRFEF